MTEEKTIEGQRLPYVMAYGVITKTLDKLIQAATPARFTQDFLATKLAIKGGTAKSVIPFLKRTGFLNSDGSPTDLYNQFRNDSLRDVAGVKAIKHGFAPLYEMNEYVHDLKESELKSLVVQATGMASSSSTVRAIVGSFNALKAYANFEVVDIDQEDEADKLPKKEAENGLKTEMPKSSKQQQGLDLKLGYTINLNLPATPDTAVYDAIFKSLKDNLLN